MDVKQRTLKETFENEFSMERFERWTKEFFNRVKIVAPYKKNINYLSEFAFYIATHSHIADFTDSEKNKIAVLAVELRKGRSIEKARSMQRNFISKLISGNVSYDAAIVAFYCEDESRWRLSLVRLDKEFLAGGKIKTSITPAKRFSYLVGKGEPCRTAMDQLYPIFQMEEFEPTLDKIEEAFSVESVTKDFFDKYKEEYYQLKEYLDENEQFVDEATLHGFTSEQFAKKLMGQLAFLYFLQKKGWLGVKVVPQIINKKQYDDAYFKKQLINNYYTDKASKYVIPKIYKQKSANEYRLQIQVLLSDAFSDNEADILAGCFKSEPWGSGTKSFIRDLFDHCLKQEGKYFFDDFLEPLFYEALRINRGKNHYYKRFNCKIPFLNGGLFDPLENYEWDRVRFDIPNEIFSNKHIKGERDADGILDIFERYNFTMNEDEPLEREIAIDPEMLGKIFENLLDIKDRKSKGAFYTPREIVHYMCQESLCNYLVNELDLPYEDVKDFVLFGEIRKDEDCSKNVNLEDDSQRSLPRIIYSNLARIDYALSTIKVADPAVGSGAFPLGMLSEIVKLRNIITEYRVHQIPADKKFERKLEYHNRNQYNIKLDTIKNSIFAVDIESSAVDIAKLRLWLSLVVDQEVNIDSNDSFFDSDDKDPRPLPNLDYNIMCGNSLIDEFDGVNLFDDEIFNAGRKSLSKEGEQTSLFEDQIEALTKRLNDEQERFFDENDSVRKEAIKNNINRIIDSIIRAKLSRNNNQVGLVKYEASLKEKTKPYFLWKLEFAKVFKEKDGFDVVIGNPPYVGQKKNNESFKEVKATEFGKKYHQRRMDFFYFFFHKGLDLLRENGILSFITTNYFLTATYGDKLRLDFKTRSTIVEIINLNELKIFESALGQHNAITVLRKGSDRKAKAKLVSVQQGGFGTDRILKDIFMYRCKNTVYSTNINSEIYEGELNYIRIKLNKYSDEDILNRIMSGNKPLNEYFDVIEGIHTGADTLSNSHIEKYEVIMEKGKGIFVLSSDELVELQLNSEERTMIKPWYKNSDINRWGVVRNVERHLIYYNSKKDYKNIPNIQSHLKQFQIILINRKVRSGTGFISIQDYNDFVADKKYISYVMNASAFKKGNYFAISYPREEYVFTGEKVICPQRSLINTFAFHDGDFFASADVYFIKNKKRGLHLKYLLALLNSKLYYYWMYNKGKLKGMMLELYIRPLSEIPVPYVDIIKQNQFIELVDKIIKAKKSECSSDVSDIETQINKLVYELFGLTQKEIDIVEGGIGF